MPGGAAFQEGVVAMAMTEYQDKIAILTRGGLRPHGSPWTPGLRPGGNVGRDAPQLS